MAKNNILFILNYMYFDGKQALKIVNYLFLNLPTSMTNILSTLVMKLCMHENCIVAVKQLFHTYETIFYFEFAILASLVNTLYMIA